MREPAGLWAARRRVRLTVTRHRRMLAAACAAGAVAAGLDLVAPPEPALAAVVGAARDVPAGVVMRADDVRLLRLPPDAVPDGALADPSDVVGRTAAGPLRRGETITDVRLVGTSLLEGADAAALAVPVRLADRDAAGLVAPGDRVDVLAAPLGDGARDHQAVEVVASAALVLAVPAGDDIAEGSLIVLAVGPATARRLARAATSARLTVALRRPT